MKINLFWIMLLALPYAICAQEIDHGNNHQYTEYHHFAAPVAQPTDINAPIPFPIANMEKDIVQKKVEPAQSGTHFQPGLEGAKTVRYDLNITDTLVNFTGKKRKSIAVNGQYPAPTLSFTVGDTALVYVHNYSKEPTSVHWHGVQLPNRMDGVPFLTQQPIPPQTTYVYKFPVVQSGTYWYHSHFMLQEQIGLFGALIFNKRTEPEIPTIPVVLSDWSDMQPEEIYRMLRTGNDWFAIQKNSVQSYWEALKSGHLGVKLTNEWKRMEAMDISDVYYEQFQTNGLESVEYKSFKAHDKVRLRVVNGGSSSYFWLTYSGGKITVVANDGNDVKPTPVDRLIIAPSETYDVWVTLPEDKQFEFLATAEDRSGYTSLWLGDGPKVPAEKFPKLDYFKGMKMMNEMMTMGGNMHAMDMEMALQEMDMNAVMYKELKNVHNDHEAQHTSHSTGHHPQMEHENGNHNGHAPKKKVDMQAPVILNYNMLEATEDTRLAEEGLWKTLNFELTGNMNRYVWSMDNKTVGETDKIKVERGQNLRIILTNNSMMRHPMHLHGHDFRLLNKYEQNSPLKNVLDIMPMETDTLEFKASETGDWFFHCHILYHMMGGMGKIFEVQSDQSNPEIQNPKTDFSKLTMEERKFFLSAENTFASNGNIGEINLDNTRWRMAADWQLGYKNTKGYEVGAKVGRYFGEKQWFFPYAGVDWKSQKGMKTHKSWFGQNRKGNSEWTAQLGVQYTLPGLIVSDLSVNHYGHVLLEFSRDDIPLSRRLRGAFRLNSDKEYSVGAKYIVLKNMAISTQYDNHLGWGAGITLRY